MFDGHRGVCVKTTARRADQAEVPDVDAIIWTTIGVISALAVIACLKILATEMDNGARRQRLAAEAVLVQQKQMKRLQELRRANDHDARQLQQPDQAPDAVEVEEVEDVAEAA